MTALDLEMLATMSEEELAKTLRVDRATLGALSKTIAENPRTTIEPSAASSDAPGRLALAGLGAEREHGNIAGGLSMEATLGEGGMGIVRMATQRSLGRKVAVKTLRPGGRTERSTLHLLREAWVTGSLEHPNIVPVYDLGLDDDGAPIIVLKKIEGIEWEQVLTKPEELERRFGATDPLEYNLRILIQLSNAVSLAHARGILHRDLKPENVMIGSFGEVYLVDWGIAVSLREDPTGRLPIAKDTGRDVAGTPCYMAPEMLGAGELSERTDVYLLGAVLHEILTGTPPHEGNFARIVSSIVLSNPTYPPSVPPELAAIAKRAMSREPADRFASADELRQRLEWYLRHRGSLALSAEAGKRLAQMHDLVAMKGSREEIYHLLAEARFGFRQALAASADNEDARTGLREAIETAVTFELDRGTAEGASAALAELDEPPRELATRVSEALARSQAARERLQELDAQLDPTIGRRTRLFVALVVGLLWTVAPQLGPMMEARAANPYHAMLLWTVVLLAFGSAMSVWARESLSKTTMNRNMRSSVVVMFAGELLFQLGAELLKIPFDLAMILQMAVWFLAASFFSVLVERKLWPAPLAYFVGFLAACAYPSTKWHMMSLTNFVLVVSAVRAWFSHEEDTIGGIRENMIARRRERLSRRPPSM